MSTGSPGEPRRDRDRRTRILVRQVFFLFFFCHSHDAWGLRSVSTEVMSCVRSFSFEFQVRAPTWEGQGHPGARGETRFFPAPPIPFTTGSPGEPMGAQGSLDEHREPRGAQGRPRPPMRAQRSPRGIRIAQRSTGKPRRAQGSSGKPRQGNFGCFGNFGCVLSLAIWSM